MNYRVIFIEPTTVDEVRKLITSSPSESRDRDPLPTALLPILHLAQ